MKTGIIPDIHGSKQWKEIVEYNKEVEHWVFLGDYVDSFIHNGENIVKNLNDIIAYKKANNDKVTLLLGNHDIHYLFDDPWYRCSGYNPKVAPILHDTFNTNIALFDLATERNNYLITHAGVTENWFRRFRNALADKYAMTLTTNNIVNYLNDTLHYGPKELLDIIMQVGTARGGFEASGGPLWCDEKELKKDYLATVNQVVGHTPQRTGVVQRYITDRFEILLFTDVGETHNLTPVILDRYEE